MTFVGTERRDIVRDLRSLYAAAVADSSPYLVSLEAETGWGKTRIVQELYAELQRTAQHGQRYWPPEIVPPGTDPMRGRKVVHPENPSPEPGSTMPWLWWGIRCERDSSGRPIRALLSDRVQFRAHLDALIAAASRRQQDRELVLELLGEAVGMLPAIGTVVGATDAVMRLGPRLHRRLLDGIERRAKRNAPSPTRIETSEMATPAEVEHELQLVSRLITRDLPLVLVIDDAHLADTDTVAFVRQLMSLRVPALIITTAWPSVIEDQQADERDVAPDQRRTLGGLLDAIAARQHDRLWRFPLRPLTDEALVTIIDEAAPNTSGERREALLEASDGNPLVLSLQLMSRRVRRSVRDGAIELSASELGRLPRAFEGLVADRFGELGEDEQAWLAEAAAQGDPFFPDVMSVDVASVDREQLGGFVRFLPDDGMAVARFIERPVLGAVTATCEDEFGADERAEWAAATSARLVAWWRDGALAPPAGRQTCIDLCRLTLALSQQGASVPADVAVEAAMQWSWAERDLGHHRIELEVAERALALAQRATPPAPALEVPAGARLAAACNACNLRERSVEAATAAMSRLEDWPDASASDTWNVAYVLTHALLFNGDAAAASRVVERVGARFGADTLGIEYLRLRAEVLGEDGRGEEARALLGQALERAREATPQDTALLIDIETDLLSISEFHGPVERWLEIVALAESELGRGHDLYQASVVGAVAALVFDARFPEAIALMSQATDAGPTDDDRTTELVAQFVETIAAGEFDRVAGILAQLAVMPYSSGPYERRMQRLATASQLSFGRAPDVPLRPPTSAPDSAIDLLAQRQAWGSVPAVQQLHAFLDGDAALDWQAGMETALTASTILLRDWIAAHEPHALFGAMVLRVIALSERPGFPRLVRRRIAGLISAFEVLSGRDPEPLPDIAGDETSVVQDRAARSLAWAHRGELERAEAELEAADAVLERSGRRTRLLLRLLADAASSAALPSSQRRWRALIAHGAPEERDRLTDLAAMAADLYHLGRHAEARDLEEDVLERRRELLGEDHAETIGAKVNLAMTLEELGDFGRARSLNEQVVAVHRDQLGDDDPATVNAMARLGLDLFGLGEFAAARAVEADVLARRRRRFGDVHRETLRAKRNLSATLRKLDESNAARVLDEEALADARTLFGDDDPATVEIMSAVAVALHNSGEFAAARPLHQQVVDARRSASGSAEPATLEAMRNLAGTLHALGELEATRRLEAELLDACREANGDAHPATVDAKARLAFTLYELGHLDEVKGLESEVLDARRAAFGDDHPATLQARRELAATAYSLGDLELARELQSAVAAQRERELGDQHPDTLRAKQALFATLNGQRDLEAMLRVQGELLDAHRAMLGETAPQTLMAKRNQGVILHALGRDEEAAAFLEQVLAERREAVGDAHPDTLDARACLAVTLHGLGRLHEARDQLQAVVEGQSEVLGADHAATLEAKRQLAMVLDALGERESGPAADDRSPVRPD